MKSLAIFERPSIAAAACYSALGEEVGRQLGAALDGRCGLLDLLKPKTGMPAGFAFDLVGNLCDPLDQQIRRGVAARLEGLGRGLGTPDQQLLETADAAVEGAGEFPRRDCRVSH